MFIIYYWQTSIWFLTDTRKDTFLKRFLCVRECIERRDAWDKSETLPVQQHESRTGILQFPRILTLVQLSYAPFHQNPTTPDDEICWNQV